ncbi:RNA-directed DNA polymerase from mobile element jockey [Caerostris extrusa]|uniref:RNA-directed DNA polymerase from mobile element jockey n=1 Tax=Caerostris extrusa TaxID=172846 RepID=A0AAV4Q0E4_CAEEX|nr:RNA-directed DNA polymerase from mobile element jockey [Caerostris extrusa]
MRTWSSSPELHAFQTQLSIYNCMQAAFNSDKDVKLVAQTNDLVKKVEVLINNLSVPLAKLPATPAEAEKIKMAVEERRNSKPSTSHPTEAKLATQQQNSARPKRLPRLKKEAKRRIEDDDGFILPAKHLVARNKPATAVPVQISSNTNNFISTNPTPEVADEVIPTEQLARNLDSPIFVKTVANWPSMCILLKSVAPSMRSVLSKDRFLKFTVTSEVEHLRLKNKLVQLGLEFKCFNLKQDRPIKVLIRGLPPP